ncbi:MAG: hypothetical protein GX946_10895 [Oligosphaeraceae bacterium]|nr:hypothetical protein [Oligosphaeraceae bacterium]
MWTLMDGLVNHRYLGTHRFEMTPFHWNGELYLLENFCDYDPASYAKDEYPEHTARDGFFIRRFSDDAQIGPVVPGCYYASSIVHQDRLYVFASAFDTRKFTAGVSFRRIIRYTTDDLEHWSGPDEVYVAAPDRMIFNTTTVWDGKRFVGCFETDETCTARKYLFRFVESDDLLHFRVILGAEYGREKYVGGQALYFVNGYYYLFYVHDLNNRCYDTRISRSKDLKIWEDSPIPVVEPDQKHEINPMARPGIMELNASDLELIEDQGKTLLFWCGGDQHGCVDMQMAEYPRPLPEYLESFFA